MAELATIARPYAEAVYQLAKERNEQDAWGTTLELLQAVTQSAEFKRLSLNPKVTTDQIVDLLYSFLLEKKLGVSSEHLQKLLLQLVSYRRLNALPEVLLIFQNMCNAAQNVAEVVISTAYPLSDKQLKELLPILEKRFGKQLKPQVNVDKSLIGGICAVVGDDTLDMSVKARLETMKQALVA